jgi:UDP-4-amino-4-deoxy-L-arabinose formyltransferase/UDP-glucuronic acid dehydrogenase (UDP-4-keto-hexauronic acid decarboxylating)
MNRVVVFAYHDVGCMGVRTLAALGIEVARVYTHEDDPGENHWFGSVRRTCAELGVTCTTANPHDPAELDVIRGIAPDAIFSLYYRDMIKDSVLSLAKRGGFNLHGSYLPRYRGRAPVNWQILHGETQGGVTLHHMVRRAVRRSARAVLDGTAPRIRQMESKATYYGRRRPEDGLIDWHWCAQDVRNLVRAVTHPYPGAFTSAEGKKVLVWNAELFALGDKAAAPAPGTIIRSGYGVVVAGGDRRRLKLTRVEIDGREGDAREFPEILKDGLVLGGA